MKKLIIALALTLTITNVQAEEDFSEWVLENPDTLWMYEHNIRATAGHYFKALVAATDAKNRGDQTENCKEIRRAFEAGLDFFAANTALRNSPFLTLDHIRSFSESDSTTFSLKLIDMLRLSRPHC